MTAAQPRRVTFNSRSMMNISPGTLSLDDLRNVANRFGVAESQVRRDHSISHVLAVIAAQLPDAVIFFGGTALSRTHLADARLSEDVDLVATGPRRETADLLTSALDAGLRRVLGRPRWNPGFAESSDVTPAVLEVGEDVAIKIQLLADGTIHRGRSSGAHWNSDTPTRRRPP